MNTTLILNTSDYLSTFSLLTYKLEYNKVHHQNVKKYYFNGRVGFFCWKINIFLRNVFNNIKFMNLIGLILFVVVLKSEDVLPKSRIDKDGVILQVY